MIFIYIVLPFLFNRVLLIERKVFLEQFSILRNFFLDYIFSFSESFFVKATVFGSFK